MIKKHGERFEYRGKEYTTVGGDRGQCDKCAFYDQGSCMYDGEISHCYDFDSGEDVIFIQVDPNAIEREYTRDELMSSLGLASYDVLIVDGKVL